MKLKNVSLTAAGDSKSEVIKNGAQLASYLWSYKFLRSHILFVLRVIFLPKRQEELSDFKTSAAKEIVKLIL